MIAFTLLCSACGTSSPRKSTVRYYVSMGDSYAVGFQPAPTPGATPGYSEYVARAEHLRLENFGCAGATSTSILDTPGCVRPYGPAASTDAVAYGTTSQAAAAEAFIKAHRGSIGLITVSIGGNDVTKCATDPDPITCFFSAVGGVRANVSKLARALRAAAGAGVPIIGLTYPDVLLGLWVHPIHGVGRSLAELSVTGFKSDLNPALQSAYGAGRATFLDITAATGAYTPLTETTSVSPYGVVPQAVAQVCSLTWYCSLGSIHPTSLGYTFIGRQIVAKYAVVLPPKP